MGAAAGAVAKARARPGMVAAKAAKVEGGYRTGLNTVTRKINIETRLLGARLLRPTSNLRPL